MTGLARHFFPSPTSIMSLWVFNNSLVKALLILARNSVKNFIIKNIFVFLFIAPEKTPQNHASRLEYSPNLISTITKLLNWLNIGSKFLKGTNNLRMPDSLFFFQGASSGSYGSGPCTGASWSGGLKIMNEKHKYIGCKL